MSLCKNCPSKSSCTQLCPEANTYAKQDWVYLQELPIGLPIFSLVDTDIEEIERNNAINLFLKFSREKQVVTLLRIGLSRKNIAQALGITRKNLKNIIYRISQKGNKIPKIR